MKKFFTILLFLFFLVTASSVRGQAATKKISDDYKTDYSRLVLDDKDNTITYYIAIR
jgi:hypothetical protein